MTPTAFDPALDFIMSPDRDGHQDDSAPGEVFRTTWGVTQATWNAAVADGIVSGDLAYATRGQCAAIYHARYWNALRCASLPQGIAFAAFVDATLTGVGHVARLLQRLVGVAEDGAIGPVTLAAVRAYPDGQVALIDDFIAADEAYLRTLADAPRFLRGWTRREEALRAATKAIAGSPSRTAARST